jgi:hypothetical protein
MPEALAQTLAFLGLLSAAAAAIQYSMRDYFGERVSSNLERAGNPKLAAKWNRSRGHRVSVVGAAIFAAIGGVLILGGAVVAVLQ